MVISDSHWVHPWWPFLSYSTLYKPCLSVANCHQKRRDSGWFGCDAASRTFAVLLPDHTFQNDCGHYNVKTFGNQYYTLAVSNYSSVGWIYRLSATRSPLVLQVSIQGVRAWYWPTQVTLHYDAYLRSQHWTSAVLFIIIQSYLCRSILCLIMPWFLGWAGHHWPWY